MASWRAREALLPVESRGSTAEEETTVGQSNGDVVVRSAHRSRWRELTSAGSWRSAVPSASPPEMSTPSRPSASKGAARSAWLERSTAIYPVGVSLHSTFPGRFTTSHWRASTSSTPCASFAGPL